MSQLLLQLNVTENHERFLRYVQRTSVTSVKVTQASSGATRKRLADLSGDTAAFNGHYDHLRQMQLRELDSFVALLGKIADDAELSAALAAICLDKEAGEMQLSDSSTSANGAGRASSTTTSEAVASLRDLQRIEAAMAEALMHPNAAVAAATTNVSPLLITTTGAESPVQAALAAGAKSGAKKGPNPLGATTGATQVTSLPALVALPASAKKDVLSKLVSTTSGTAHSADKVLETNIGPKMPPWVRTGEHVSVLNLKKVRRFSFQLNYLPDLSAYVSVPLHSPRIFRRPGKKMAVSSFPRSNLARWQSRSRPSSKTCCSLWLALMAVTSPSRHLTRNRTLDRPFRQLPRYILYLHRELMACLGFRLTEHWITWLVVSCQSVRRF